MKKLLTIFLGIVLILPLYPQKTSTEVEQEVEAKQAKKEKEYTRQSFELRLAGGIGVEFDNTIIGANEIFRKKIVIDMSELADRILDDGAGINFGFFADILSFDIKNIHIGKGLWNFGLTTNVDGNLNFNFSKSLFTLIAEGNAESHKNSGKIGGKGGIFSEIGIPISTKYQAAGKILTIGLKPSLYTPVVYIPSSTGIYYKLTTEEDVDGEKKDGFFLKTYGGLDIYTSTSFNNINPAEFFFGSNGFDISLEGEYCLFPFLDIGASLSQIPIAPATLTNGMRMSLEDFQVSITGDVLFNGGEPDTPDFDFKDMDYFTDGDLQVYRPFRFDFYANYKPLAHTIPDLAKLIYIKPNIGFSLNPTKGEEKTYFNAGLEIGLNLKDLFKLYIGSGYKEEIWKQKAGFALNFRVFELDLEASLRSQTFEGCFELQGLGVFLGTRWGW